MNCSKVLLSSLLPYEASIKKNGHLLTGLKEYQMLIRACCETYQLWQEGEFEKFDSLVGENACQIRAIWIASHAAKESTFFHSLNDQFTLILTKIDQLLIPSTISRLMHTDISLKEIFANEELEVLIETDELFLLASFLLCLMKDVKEEKLQMTSLYRKEIADPKKAIQLGEVSGSFAKNLLSKLRQTLSTLSVQFVRQTGFAFQDSELVKMLSEEFVIEQNALTCIPMFWTYKTVLDAASLEGIPLILHAKFLSKNEQGFDLIDEHKLFFMPDDTGSYIQIEPSLKDLNKPACVIQGVVTPHSTGHLLSKEQWSAEMNRTSIVDVILAGAADHRQYPDPKLDDLFTTLENTEYASYKTRAKNEGYSSENSSTFFIQHVYAALTKNHMEAQVANYDTSDLLFTEKQAVYNN